MEPPSQIKAPRRFKKRWVLWILFFGIFIAPATVSMLKQKAEISSAVAHAKSIRLEHFRSGIDMIRWGEKKERIIATKDLVPADFHKIEEAFPICPDIGVPGLELGCLFNPHHRIVITDENGHVTMIEVCFECDHVGIKSGDQEYGNVQGTPVIWMATLRRFFADEGMPNSPDLYRQPPRISTLGK